MEKEKDQVKASKSRIERNKNLKYWKCIKMHALRHNTRQT